MRSGNERPALRLLLQTGALILSAASLAGAQASDQNASSAQPRATLTQLAPETSGLSSPQAAQTAGSRSSGLLAPETNLGDLGIGIKADYFATLRWTPERATADLTPTFKVDAEYMALQPAGSSQPPASTARTATGPWKPYEGSSLTVPGTPIPYMWTGGQSAQIFRLSW